MVEEAWLGCLGDIGVDELDGGCVGCGNGGMGIGGCTAGHLSSRWRRQGGQSLVRKVSVRREYSRKPALVIARAVFVGRSGHRGPARRETG